jgi:hypothetical protein
MLTAAAVVVCALDLLGRSQASVPIRFLETPPRGASRNVEAFVTRHPDTIYLITTTDAFQSARRGPYERGSNEGCRHIAGVIVHEEWHLRNGDDEEGAYLAQLTALASLGASNAMLGGVRRSMMFVLDQQKRRRRELVALQTTGPVLIGPPD